MSESADVLGLVVGEITDRQTGPTWQSRRFSAYTLAVTFADESEAGIILAAFASRKGN